MSWFDQFREIWFVDFEFKADAGERPVVHCMVGHELRTGDVLKLWVDELGTKPPIQTTADVLLVAYFASAEMGCYRALGWPTPCRILDLYTEFRCKTNGVKVRCGRSLLGAMAHHGLDSMAAAEKESLRELAIRGAPFTSQERTDLLDYCESDVVSLERLFKCMAPKIDLGRALLRGRYMAAVACMEHCGTPIDVDELQDIRDNWEPIKAELVSRVDRAYGVYEGNTFKLARFGAWLRANEIPWPTLESGRLATDKNTFSNMAKAFPIVGPLKELRHTLGEMRLEKLLVGGDGRNRTLISPFSSKTGRNQPSNSKFIFGPSCWLRGLIKPQPGRAIAYVDYSQQEFAIAAALSGDERMMEAYVSGDPYITFAKQAGAVPDDATKESHPEERAKFKVCALAVQFGMGSQSLAMKITKQTAYGRELLGAHKRAYRKFWGWSDGAVTHAMLHETLWTVFGWWHFTDHEPNPRSLSNFPVQANGAEMLRLACCLATERGINVCAPVHDAILVESSVGSIDRIVRETQAAMDEAGRSVLDGFEVRTDAKIVRYPDRYMDERGELLWEEIVSIRRGRKRPETMSVPNLEPASAQSPCRT